MTIPEETSRISAEITSLVRRPYEPPTLKEFGPVGVLTQGGTGMFMEGVLMLAMLLNRT